ncbi:MAG TPA: hypothetical protein VF173_06230 [Thermoanaerobaculia bacterium]|nr:hypothetical protein [Thermoanaerobaculia bacterium]
MLTRLLVALSNLLIRSFDGLVSFLAEFLPALCRFLFTSSPLLLSVFLTYYVAGGVAATIASAITVILLTTGLLWARRQHETEAPRISWSVIVSVIVLDVLVVVGSFTTAKLNDEKLRKQRVARRSELVDIVPVAGTEKERPSQKAKVFAQAASEALGFVEGQYGDPHFNIPLFNRYLAELRDMHELHALDAEKIVARLQYCRNKVHSPYDSNQKPCAQLAPILIKLAVEADMSSACKTLYEIQTEEGILEADSRAASAKLCGE